MEIFTFVKMGGKNESMVIKLLDETDASLATRLIHFDAGQARCYLAKDRHGLWAVIESSFGTFKPFNKIVRGILSEKLKAKPPNVAHVDATPEESSAVSA